MQSFEATVANTARASLSSLPRRRDAHAPQGDARVMAATANPSHQDVIVAVWQEPTDVPDKTELR